MKSNLLNRMLAGELKLYEDIYVHQTMTDINFYMILGSCSGGLYGIKAVHHIAEYTPKITICSIIYDEIDASTWTLLDFRLLTDEEEYKLVKSKIEDFILNGDNIYRSKKGLEVRENIIKEEHITFQKDDEGDYYTGKRNVVYSSLHGKYIYEIRSDL